MEKSVSTVRDCRAQCRFDIGLFRACGYRRPTVTVNPHFPATRQPINFTLALIRGESYGVPIGPDPSIRSWQGRGAGAIQVLVHAVERRLITGIGVDGRHKAVVEADEPSLLRVRKTAWAIALMLDCTFLGTDVAQINAPGQTTGKLTIDGACRVDRGSVAPLPGTGMMGMGQLRA